MLCSHGAGICGASRQLCGATALLRRTNMCLSCASCYPPEGTLYSVLNLPLTRLALLHVLSRLQVKTAVTVDWMNDASMAGHIGKNGGRRVINEQASSSAAIEHPPPARKPAKRKPTKKQGNGGSGGGGGGGKATTAKRYAEQLDAEELAMADSASLLDALPDDDLLADVDIGL